MAETFTQQVAFGPWLYGYETDGITGKTRATIINSADPTNGFNPLSVSPLAWYDPSDIASLYQDNLGATPVTATGQTVGQISDKSGHGYHLRQATLGNRGTYQTGYIDMPGTAGAGYASTAIAGAPAIYEVYVALRNLTDTSWVCYSQNTGTANGSIGYVVSGNAGGTYAQMATAPITLVNAVVNSPDTAANLYTLIGNTAGKVVEFQNVNPTLTLTEIDMFAFASFEFLGRCYGILVTPVLTTAQRAQIRTYLGAKMGIVL